MRLVANRPKILTQQRQEIRTQLKTELAWFLLSTLTFKIQIWLLSVMESMTSTAQTISSYKMVFSVSGLWRIPNSPSALSEPTTASLVANSPKNNLIWLPAVTLTEIFLFTTFETLRLMHLSTPRKTSQTSTQTLSGKFSGSRERIRPRLLFRSLVMVVLLSGPWRRALSTATSSSLSVKLIQTKKMFTQVPLVNKKPAAWPSSTQEVCRLTSQWMILETITSLRQKTAQSTSAPLHSPNDTRTTTTATWGQFTVCAATHTGMLMTVQSF